MDVVEATTALGDEPRGQRIFLGELIVFRALDTMGPLVTRADTIMQAAFAKDANIADCYQAALSAAGTDPNRIYWDRLRLRIQPPGDSHMSRRVINLAPHGYTWDPNVLAQHNWCAPIYPVTPERTMVIYPAHWRNAITNTRGNWDNHELLARRRAGDDSYPLLSVATAQIDNRGA